MRYMTASEIRRAPAPMRVRVARKIRRTAGSTPMQRRQAKLAVRYLLANMARDRGADLMARLQVLEGVAGKPSGKWSYSGDKGLAMAKAEFTGTVHPDWFSRKNTGLLLEVYKGVAKMINSSSVSHMSAEDVMQNGLMGLKAGDLDSDSQNLLKNGPILYSAGKIQHGKLSPTETPVTFGRGIGAKGFKSMALSAINTSRRRNKMRQENPEIENTGHGYGGGDKLDFSGKNTEAEMMKGLLFALRNQGQRPNFLRAQLRSQFDSQARGSVLKQLHALLEKMEGGLPSNLAAARLQDETGMASSTIKGNFQKYLVQAFKSLQRDRSFTRELEFFMESQG